MSNRCPPNHRPTKPSIGTLLKGIATDAKTLLNQEIQAAKLEVYKELDKVEAAVLLFGPGIGVFFIGTILLMFMLVHGLQNATALPLTNKIHRQQSLSLLRMQGHGRHLLGRKSIHKKRGEVQLRPLWSQEWMSLFSLLLVLDCLFLSCLSSGFCRLGLSLSGFFPGFFLTRHL